MTDTTHTHPPDTTQPATAAAYTGPERRSSMRVWQDKVDSRLREGDAQMRALRSDLDLNTASTQRVEANTAELVQLLGNAKGAFNVLEFFGKLARPMGAIAALAASAVALWTSLKGGGKL